jgi:hypothetical protein
MPTRWINGKIIWTHEGRGGCSFEFSSDEATYIQKRVEHLLEKGGFSKFLQRSASHHLRNYLAQKLPEYMVPSNFIFLKKMPLTPNGKIDRRALPENGDVLLESESVYVQPQNIIEEVLVDMWEEVLGIAHIGTYDNFFRLGGHSLLVTQVISRINHIFRIELPLSILFDHPTIAELANVLVKYESAPGQMATIARLQKRIQAMSPDEVQAILHKKSGIQENAKTAKHERT